MCFPHLVDLGTMPTEETRAEDYREWLDKKNVRQNKLKELLQSWYSVPTKLTIEIGCGHGHYLTAFASQHEQEVCLGVDLITRRITRANAKRDKRNLGNLHFVKADIRECIEVLPPTITFQRIFILFPDPWPKKRHAKNRIIQTELMTFLAERTNPGTQLHFRTDHEEHFLWGLEIIGAHPMWKIDDECPWPLEQPSYFQEIMGDYQSLTAIRLDGE
jgi:tRNA (guanine-N7-)-methyltransferase